MLKTTNNNIQIADKMTAKTETMMDALDCGRATAVKIGEAAGAKIRIGKRVLWNLNKVQRYLDSIAEVASDGR